MQTIVPRGYICSRILRLWTWEVGMWTWEVGILTSQQLDLFWLNTPTQIIVKHGFFKRPFLIGSVHYILFKIY